MAAQIRCMMNRREFAQLAVGAGLAQVLPGVSAQRADAQSMTGVATGPAKQRFSVMLWVLQKQTPFDRCLEIVAEAGYQGVELTGQFKNWTATDIQPVMAKMRSLGMVFDLLSGVRVGFSDPSTTAPFLAAIADQIKFARSWRARRSTCVRVT